MPEEDIVLSDVEQLIAEGLAEMKPADELSRMLRNHEEFRSFGVRSSKVLLAACYPATAAVLVLRCLGNRHDPALCMLLAASFGLTLFLTALLHFAPRETTVLRTALGIAERDVARQIRLRTPPQG
jgi:hypothetical protein